MQIPQWPTHFISTANIENFLGIVCSATAAVYCLTIRVLSHKRKKVRKKTLWSTEIFFLKKYFNCS